MTAWVCGGLAALLALVVLVPMFPPHVSGAPMFSALSRLLLAGERDRAAKLTRAAAASPLAQAARAALDASAPPGAPADVDARVAAAETAFDTVIRAALVAAVRRWWLAAAALALAGATLWLELEAGAWSGASAVAIAAVLAVTKAWWLQRQMLRAAGAGRATLLAALKAEPRGAPTAAAR